MADTFSLVRVGQIQLGDGLVGAMICDNSILVVSPNANFIPEITQGCVSVYLCKNFRYGRLDPLQWPQVYTARYSYFAAVSTPRATAS